MSSPPATTFARIERLPPYVFSITSELKMAARRRGEDIIDFGMGNPDGPTPRHIVDKLVETVQRPDTHGYSVSKGIPRLRAAILSSEVMEKTYGGRRSMRANDVASGGAMRSSLRKRPEPSERRKWPRLRDRR